MKNSIAAANERACKLLVDQLIAQGVKMFCVSPGSRTTPLTLAIAEHPEAQTTVHFDERGSSFFALGYAKASRAPVAIVVTSGTAVGNLFPAVMEASLAQVPLIILTADRPPELQDCGANQTADQVKIFGDYVRWYAELPCPTEEIDDAYLASTAAHAVFRSRSAPKGPVHLNCMFREPLSAERPPTVPTLCSTRYEMTEAMPSQSSLKSWAEILSSEEKGVIVCGEFFSEHDLSAVNDLASALDWPLFADILSPMRSSEKGAHFTAHFDLILKTVENLKVSTILHFGARPLSKTLAEWIASCRPKNYLHVADHPYRHDPKHQVTHRLAVDPALFSQSVLPYIKKRPAEACSELFKVVAPLVQEELAAIFAEKKRLSEPGLAYFLSQNLPSELAIFLSNSMPVRDADLFYFPPATTAPIFANRGLSGIDGNIATAIGLAQGAKRPLLALLGDLAFLHDLNSLALLKEAEYPVALLVINNKGGAIFSFLPVASRKETKKELLEKFFAAEHEITFQKAAELFNLPYHRIETGADLKTALEMPNGSCIIEMNTDRAENHCLHQEITKQLKERLCLYAPAAVR